MRFANRDGRFVLASGDEYVDVATASDGRFSPDPLDALDRWSDLRGWAGGQELGVANADSERTAGRLRTPMPIPRQVFGIGLNYRDHIMEAGLTPPDMPAVFTKFPSCITGPTDQATLPAGSVDWEVELGGRYRQQVRKGQEGARTVPRSRSDDWAGPVRAANSAGRTRAAISLGKSFPGFAPCGPELVTVDEFADTDILRLGCSFEGGASLQNGRTGDLIFGVPELIARLPAVCPLLPGDLIFTGTPAGVGGARTPPIFLNPGDILVSWIEGLGSLRNPMVATPDTESDGEPASRIPTSSAV